MAKGGILVFGEVWRSAEAVTREAPQDAARAGTLYSGRIAFE